MPKIKKNFFDESLTFEKMYDAFLRARENKSKKHEVMLFEERIEENIVKLIKELQNGTYCIGKYTEFYVYEPKKRVIKTLPFRDRVVHQWYVYEFIIPALVPRFIHDSNACIKTRGTHNAVRTVSKYMRRARKNFGDYYVLKMDIKKYFYTIDPDILMSILKKYFGDKKFLDLSEKLIYERGVEKGIPIGNYTSQYFANIYLNELDYYVKHELKIKYYVRFMDDFVLLVENKDIARKLYFKLEKFLEANLKLELNPKSKYFPNKMGIDFCGYRIFHTHKLVRNRSKKGALKKIKLWNKLHRENNLNYEAVLKSIKSWRGHIKHANSYNLESRYLDKIEFKDKLEGERFYMASRDFKKDVLLKLTNDEKVSILHDLMKEDTDLIQKVYLMAIIKYSKVNSSKIASSIYKMLNSLNNDDVIEFSNSRDYDFSNEHDASFDMINFLLEDHFIYLNKFKDLNIKDAYQKYLFGILKGIQKYLFESNSESVEIFQDDLNVIGSDLFTDWKKIVDDADLIKKSELTIKSWYGFEF